MATFKLLTETKQVQITEKDNTFVINIPDENNDEKTLRVIDYTNRQYVAQLHKCDLTSERDNFGCLTTRVLGLKDIPLIFINVKHLTNVFLEMMRYLSEPEMARYFIRDENYPVPTSEDKLTSMMQNMYQYHNSDGEAMETDDASIDIRFLFMEIIKQIADAFNSNNGIKRKLGTFQKKANMMGGVPNLNSDFVDSLKDKFEQTLKLTANKTHSLIQTHKSDIIAGCQKYINFIINLINQSPNTPLYQNIQLNNRHMMETVTNIISVLTINILPKTSMLDCMYLMLYHSAFLYEMNILDQYYKLTQLPITYRLIYSFYEDNNKPQSIDTNDENLQKVYTLISKLHDTVSIDRNLEILSQIAVWFNLQICNNNNNIDRQDQFDYLSEQVYWMLNEKRKATYEYYLIIIMVLYIMGKCQNVNKTQKILNCKTFAEPIYKILLDFQKYIIHDINDQQTVLCTSTLDNFNKLYAHNIKECLNKFFKNISKF